MCGEQARMEGARFAPEISASVIDQQVSISVADRLGILLPVGQDHRIQDLAAGDAMPGMEEDLPGIVP
jgi:hypothetical protein